MLELFLVVILVQLGLFFVVYGISSIVDVLKDGADWPILWLSTLGITSGLFLILSTLDTYLSS